MIKFIKPIAITLALVIFLMGVGTVAGVLHLKAADKANQNTTLVADTNQAGPEAAEPGADTAEVKEKSADQSTTGKAVSAALAIGLAAIGGTLSMGNAISKSNDGVARQPEAAPQIQTLLMLGLVFIETVVIYALIVAILIIFVL